MLDNLYIADKSLEELLSIFNCDINSDDDFYDVIAFNIVLVSNDYFLNNLNRFKGKRMRAALFGLGFHQMKSEKLKKTLESSLHNSDELIVSEAINSLIKLEYFNFSDELMHLFLKHDSPYIRSIMLKYVRCSLKSEAFQLLIKYLVDDHFIVRESAIDELVSLNSKQSITYIKNLLNDPSAEVREAASSAIQELELVGVE